MELEREVRRLPSHEQKSLAQGKTWDIGRGGQHSLKLPLCCP